VATPQRWNVKDIQRFMVVFGLISSVFDLLTFGVLLYVFDAGEALFQTSWFMISLLTELAVVLVLRTRRSALRSRPSRLLLWSTVTVAAATFAIPFLGDASTLFGFVPLSATELAAVVLIVCGYILATEVAKAWFFREEHTSAVGAEDRSAHRT
jgi:Mg2+-importing ATPase